MKTRHLFLIICAVLLLSACGRANTTEQDSPAADTEKSAENEDNGILGSWTRTAVYLNGALENKTPANLTFSAGGTYTSSGTACATSGTYKETSEGNVTMIMTQNGCPGNIPLPFTVTYTYTINKTEDGAEQMTTITGPQMETYIRR
jgi:hypothetical protein